MNDHVCCPKGSGAATILFAAGRRSSEATREGRIHRRKRGGSFASREEKNFAVRISTAFARAMHRFSTFEPGTIRIRPCMTLRTTSCVVLVWLAAASAHAASDATLFRLFLLDGTSVVSYGEFARVDDEVVFSMPVGGPIDQPRLHVVSLQASQIDWNRTGRYAAAARYQQYADTRGENDFQLLSSDIARVLNEVALSNDKAAALTRAEQARQTLADWPATHYGYREHDVREVVSLLDEAISDLRASAGRNDFNLALVAAPEETGYELLLGAPTLVEEIDATFRIARPPPRL